LKPTVLDLFSGAGGMALGFRAAGAQCIGAVEWNEPAAKTFESLFGDEGARVFGGSERGDVNQLPVDDLLGALSTSPDIVVGGPPCQGFSRIGRAKQASLLGAEARIVQGGVTDPGRNQLYQYFLAVVRRARPKAFVMENVPGMREHLGTDFAKRISREASYSGYHVRYFLLNAAEYGVPQLRWRLFFVGIRNDFGVHAIPRPPPRTHSLVRGASLGSVPDGSSLPEDRWMIAGADLPQATQLQPAACVRDALGDLPRLRGHLQGVEPGEQRRASRGPLSDYANGLRHWPGLPTVEDTSGHWYRYTGCTHRDATKGGRDFPIFRDMAQGDRYPEALGIAHRRFREALGGLASRPLPGSDEWEDLKSRFVPPYRNDAFHDKWRKLVADEPSWTVTAHLSKDTYSHIHYDSRQARTVTIREAARLQSFPDAVDFHGNFGSQFRQIGNAVPPLLARAIATELLAQLQELERSRRPVD
jgi:DNA (cytosine-5)-methyltransferase 1